MSVSRIYLRPMRSCASCGAPPDPKWISCIYCARPNFTHPQLAKYVGEAALAKEMARPSPMSTRTPMIPAYDDIYLPRPTVPLSLSYA